MSTASCSGTPSHQGDAWRSYGNLTVQTTLWSRPMFEQTRHQSSKGKLLRMSEGEERPCSVAVGSGGAVGGDQSPTRIPGVFRFI